MVDSLQAVERAQESLEWHADFEAGQFHVHCHKCGTGEPYLPPEFFGLARSDKQAAEDVLALAAALADTERRLETLTMAGPQRDWDVRATRAEARVAELEAALQAIEGCRTTVDSPTWNLCEIARAALAAHPSGCAKPGGEQ